MPSHVARSAPAIQPITACGPPITATISGMVMNAPMPHICVMLIAVPENRPIDRWKPSRRAGPALSLVCMSGLSSLVVDGCRIATGHVIAGKCQAPVLQAPARGADHVRARIMRSSELRAYPEHVRALGEVRMTFLVGPDQIEPLVLVGEVGPFHEHLGVLGQVVRERGIQILRRRLVHLQ